MSAVILGVSLDDQAITPGSPEWAKMMVADLPVHIDLTGCTSLTPAAHATVCSLVRAAGRFDRDVTVEGWNQALRNCFDRFANADWIDEVFTATIGPAAIPAMPNQPRQTIEMKSPWNQN